MSEVFASDEVSQLLFTQKTNLGFTWYTTKRHFVQTFLHYWSRWVSHENMLLCYDRVLFSTPWLMSISPFKLLDEMYLLPIFKLFMHCNILWKMRMVINRWHQLGKWYSQFMNGIHLLCITLSVRVTHNTMLTLCWRGIFMTSSIILCSHSTTSNEELFIQDFLVILKRKIQNY